MFEKVNPCHPDKVADRVAGAIVDIAYKKENNPKIAVEVLLGHGHATIIIESNVNIPGDEIQKVVKRIAHINNVKYIYSPQDVHLAANQEKEIRCGDNGIFKGTPITKEQRELCSTARILYNEFQSDGKYILDKKNKLLVICQSNAASNTIKDMFPNAIVNPLGDWLGGSNVDSGATNRKLGSDMGDSVTGGGLHGKDLSKADVSVNIYAFLKAQETKQTIELCCAIGDTQIDGKPYSEIVEIARKYIDSVGGFEKFAEWGLVK